MYTCGMVHMYKTPCVYTFDYPILLHFGLLFVGCERVLHRSDAAEQRAAVQKERSAAAAVRTILCLTPCAANTH